MPVPASSVHSPSSSSTSASSTPSDVTSPTRSRVASSLPSKRLPVEEIDDLLSQIPPSFLQSKDFNPFSHYDDSVEDLQGYHDLIRDAIDLIVDVHHKGFNTATAAFTHVVDSFASSQSTVSRLLSTLNDSRRLLTSRSDHLKEYWTQTQTLTLINHTLAKLSYIQTIPSHLSTLTNNKLHLHSVILLTHTLHMMSEEDLREVEGLLDLREELLSLKNSIVDLLMDELHQAIYHPHTKDKDARESIDKEDPRDDLSDPSSSTHRPPSTAKQGVGGGSEGSTRKAAVASASPVSSAAATLSFLSSSPFSPFSPSSSYIVDPASEVAPDSQIFTDPSYRSLSHLLAEERSPAFLSHPLSSTPRLLSLLTAALDHLNALPAAKTQITRRVRAEVTAIIEREKTVIREKMKGRTPRRRIPAVPTLSTPQGVRIPRVSPADGDRLALFLSRLFPLLLAVLRHHVELIHLINLRLLIRTEGQGGGGKKGKGKATQERDDPRWSIASMWETVQIEVQVALQDVLFSVSGGPSHSLKLSTQKKGGGEELHFSFDDSNAPSIARMSRGKEEKTAYERQLEKKAAQAQQKAEMLAIVTPSPYNVIVIYRPVLTFTTQVTALVYPKSPAPSSQLMAFLSLFLASSFLPRLQADVNIEVDAIFSAPQAFDAIEAPNAVTRGFGPAVPSKVGSLRGLSPAFTVSPPPLRLRCVVAVGDLLDTLLSDVTSLPHTVGDYVELMESVIGRVLTACEDRYGEACRGVWSASRLLDTQVRQGMEEEAAYREIILQAGPTSSATTPFSPSNPLYSPFFSPDFSLRGDQLLTDPRAVSDVCLIAESVEWLSDYLYYRCEKGVKVGLGSKVGGRKGRAGKREKSSKNRARSPPTQSQDSVPAQTSQPLPSFRLDGPPIPPPPTPTPPTSPASSPPDPTLTLSRGFLPLSSSLTSLATRCLLTLRLDLLCLLFSSLSTIQHSTYAIPSPPTEPQLFILTLSTSLSTLDDTFTRLMSYGVRPYLHSNLIQWVSVLFIHFVTQLRDKRVTRQGVTQLHVDLFALHQLLLGVRVGWGRGGGGAGEVEEEGEAFDRCVYYLDLLLLSEEELLEGDHTSQFTREQIKAIQSLTRTQPRDPPPS